MKYTSESLDQLRFCGDPSADAIIEQFHQMHLDIGKVNEVLRILLSSHFVIPHELPEFFRQWLYQESRLPEGINWFVIERNADFYSKNAFAFSLILSTSSLLEAYASSPGNRVLTLSHRLEYDVRRRIAETAQFYINVQSPGAFGKNGLAVASLLKVRLMHAAVRYLIRHSGKWDEELYGTPICQEDLLGTLLAFSAIINRDLPKLGIAITPEQAEDMLYTWKIAGGLLGIRREMMPENMEEASELINVIQKRNHKRTNDGKVLTEALLSFHEAVLPGHLHNLAPALMRHLVGEEVADLLHIDDAKMENYIDEQKFNKFIHFLDLWGKVLITAEVFRMEGYHRTKFDIPESLYETWDKHHEGWKLSRFHLDNFTW